MTTLALDLTGAEILHPEGGLSRARLSIAEGRIVADRAGHVVDLAGYLVLPGIIDLHGDGFERHLAPRRGVMKEMQEGVVAAEAEMAASGITTGVMAQFISWEGGLRGAEYAADVFAAIAGARGSLVTDLMPQLRLETHLLDQYADLPERIAEWQVDYVVFNDHLPHDRLAEGRRPARLTGQALKAGRNPEAHLALLNALHANGAAVPGALDHLCPLLSAQGVRMGSHDDHTGDQRRAWRGRGVAISEFPETRQAAEEARAGGDAVVFGAPNVVRGSSHKGNVSAAAMVAEGLCDALASDYHYPSPRRAALALARDGVLDLARAWGLVSSGPAKVLELTDRGDLRVGKRADLVILSGETHRVAATISAGRFSYLSGDVAARFLPKNRL